MFRFFIAGFAACLAGAGLWFLFCQSLNSDDVVGKVLNFVQFYVIALWMMASSRETAEKHIQWWSSIAGWLFGTAVLIAFLRWRQPTELLFEYLRLGITVLLIFFGHWLRRRKESQSKPH